MRDAKILVFAHPTTDLTSFCNMLGALGIKVIQTHLKEAFIKHLEYDNPDLIILDPFQNTVKLSDSGMSMYSALQSRPFQFFYKNSSETDNELQQNPFSTWTAIEKNSMTHELLASKLNQHSIPSNEINYSRAREDHSNELEINPDAYSVKIEGRTIHLSCKEFDLLKLLATKPGKVYSRDEISGEVWGKDYGFQQRTIDVHIRRLRKKLGKNIIATQKGIGYRLNAKCKIENLHQQENDFI